VDDKADVFSLSSVTEPWRTFVHQNGVGTAFYNLADGVSQVNQAGYRPYGDAVVHRDDYGSVRIAVNYSFQSYAFTQHFEPPGNNGFVFSNNLTETAVKTSEKP